MIEPFVWDGGLDAEAIRDIRRMKARIEAERIPPGEDPDFHLKLGRGSLSDVEFTAQMLQLQYGVKATGTLDALRALADSDVMAVDDAEVLAVAYEFCERVRNRWFLVNSAPGDSLPTQPEPLLWLSRSLDTTPGNLREDYRRVTRRARRVVERVFYGLPVR
jgi:glutamate-ammonia-ligase adenylyltransferase